MTTSEELIARIRAGWYDIAQPDATVIGGMGETLRVLNAAQAGRREAVVHCWGSAVAVAANYHCALAGGGELAEWPLPAYPLRDELLLTPFVLQDGCLPPPQTPGLGVRLDDDIERRYPFRPEATYHCIPLPDPATHVVWAGRPTHWARDV